MRAKFLYAFDVDGIAYYKYKVHMEFGPYDKYVRKDDLWNGVGWRASWESGIRPQPARQYADFAKNRAEEAYRNEHRVDL